MDAFETVIAAIFDQLGFWTRNSFKVELTKEEKNEIGRRSCPRWELDVLAYRPDQLVLKVIECKSYLNSHGVRARAFEPGSKWASKYKLFTDETLWKVVSGRLVAQLQAEGLVTTAPTVELCLAAGNVYGLDEPKLTQLFKKKGWHFYGPEWIRGQLRTISDGKYQNSIAAMTAKLMKEFDK